MKSPWATQVLAVLAPVILLTGSSTDAESYAPGALQSGPDLAGSSFAASVVYDPIQNAAVITGSSFGRFFSDQTDVPKQASTCFLATVTLPTDKSNDDNDIEWRVLQTLGGDEDGVMEACSSAIFHERREKLIVTGHSEVGGFLNDLYNAAADDFPSIQYGFLLDLDVDEDDEGFRLNGGRVLQESRVSYPMALATAVADDWIYVVSQETNNVERNDLDANGESLSSSNEAMDPMRFFKYGNNHMMTIERYKLRENTQQSWSDSPTTLQESFEVGWRKPFATFDDAAVHVAGIAEIGNTLVVVGTTSGIGGIFGGFDGDADPEINEDGFMATFNKETGASVNVDGGESPSTPRIQSIDGRDDWIAGLCHDPQDTEYFYIVGATGGQLGRAVPGSTSDDSIEAYIMKIKLDSLETMWTFQIGAERSESEKTQVRGISCAVSGDSVWFGGVVQNSAVLPDSGTIESFGMDDIFVAQLFSEDGAKKFVRQIGSEEDDGMAMRGGIALDQVGNCIVVGNTYGSFYRSRSEDEVSSGEWISDVFVATISAFNGAIAYPVTHSEFKSGTATGTTPHVPESHNAGGGDSKVPDPAGKDGEATSSKPTVPVTPSDPKVQAPASSDTGNSEGRGKVAGIIMLALFGSVGLIAAAFFVVRSKANRDVTTDRSKIIEYLSEFDVDDVDLKHSATGGWHCSYSNGLANGRNRRSKRGGSYGGLVPPASTPPGSDPLLMAPLTNSSVLQDSLFMEEEDTGGLGGGGLKDEGRFCDSQPSAKKGYDGLIDAYNATWREDQRPDKETNSWGKEIL